MGCYGRKCVGCNDLVRKVCLIRHSVYAEDESKMSCINCNGKDRDAAAVLGVQDTPLSSPSKVQMPQGAIKLLRLTFTSKKVRLLRRV